jgi:hypothetical protein
MQLRFASFAVINLRRDSHRKSAPMLGAPEKKGGGHISLPPFYRK